MKINENKSKMQTTTQVNLVWSPNVDEKKYTISDDDEMMKINENLKIQTKSENAKENPCKILWWKICDKKKKLNKRRET